MSKLKGQQKNDSLYNLGTSYFSKGDLEYAKDTYISLLRQDPGHDSAKKNLESVLTILKAQEQKKQQEEEQEKKEQEKKEKQQNQSDDEKKEQQQNQKQDQKKNEQERKREQRKNDAKQILNMLSEKEKEARKKHQKTPDEEIFVEKDW